MKATVKIQLIANLKAVFEGEVKKNERTIIGQLSRSGILYPSNGNIFPNSMTLELKCR